MVGRDRRARQPSSCLSTSLYKNSSALSAWFCVEAGTPPSRARCVKNPVTSASAICAGWRLP